MNDSPEFMLGVAKSLTDDVAKVTELGEGTGQRKIGDLLKDLDEALALCDRAQRAYQSGDERAAAVNRLKAYALFLKARINVKKALVAKGSGFEHQFVTAAVELFNNTLAMDPDPELQLAVATDLLHLGRREDAVELLRKCMTDWPGSDYAINAGKELARLGELGTEASDEGAKVQPKQRPRTEEYQAPPTATCPSCGASVYTTAKMCDSCWKPLPFNK